MKHLVFTIFDSKAKAYLQPFMSQTQGTAIRQLVDCLNDVNHQFHKHPADYTLFHIYDFDDTTAIYTAIPDKPPIKLIELLQTQTQSQKSSLDQMSNDEVIENLKNSEYSNQKVI